MLNFHTKNINEQFVTQIIFHTLANLKVKSLTDWLNKWDVHIWDLKSTNPEFFLHVPTTSGQKINHNMPSGVTGKYRIDLWLHDSNNEFKQRENSDRIMHEVCHTILFGTPHFVSGVHDNVNKRFSVNLHYWERFKYKKFVLSIIDIRQYL